MRNLDIARWEVNIKAQKEKATYEIKMLQELCTHDKIVHGGDRRICCVCGIEEYNHYNWPGTTADGGLYPFLRRAGQKTILNYDFIKNDDVCKYRVSL